MRRNKKRNTKRNTKKRIVALIASYGLALTVGVPSYILADSDTFGEDFQPEIHIRTAEVLNPKSVSAQDGGLESSPEQSGAETAPEQGAENVLPGQGGAETDGSEAASGGETEEPEATETPEPESPEVIPTPEPENPEAEPTPEPENPEVEPTPEPETPEATPTPEPETPEATPTPEPEVTPTPEPENPEPEPTPEPGDTADAQTPSVSGDFTMDLNPEDSGPEAPILFRKIDKVYALANRDGGVKVREGAGEEHREVGEMENGALCYIIADEDEDWIYIESGEVRGFVKADELVTGFWANAKVGLAGEETLPLAEKLIPVWENGAYTYSEETVYDVTGNEMLRVSMLQYAQQFLGGPYVWGGVSLTNGCDCSGFVQQIYRQFGYNLPRTSREQAEYGTKIDVYDAEPGDLIYYAREDGYIYHVLMYMGGGKAINAASTQEGITISDVDYEKACQATRVIEEDDTVTEQVLEGLSSQAAGLEHADGQYLGRFKLTAYCTCEICCGQWADGITASGTVPVQGRTVAMAGVPFGTKLNIGGQVFTVEDRGTPYGHIDIYMNDHEECNEFGVQYADIYLCD